MLYGLSGVLTKMQTKSIPYTFNRCGYYYFSRRVPADLTGYYSYPRIVQGLRTRSPSQAKTRALIAAAEHVNLVVFVHSQRMLRIEIPSIS
jgi:hypothetical protein